MSPGPNCVLIAKTVPTSGRAAGFANVAGFVAGFYLHGSLSIFGISLILLRSAEAFFVVKMLGAAYLCWIGIKALRCLARHRQGRRGGAGEAPPAAREGLCRGLRDQRAEPQGVDVLPCRLPAVHSARRRRGGLRLRAGQRACTDQRPVVQRRDPAVRPPGRSGAQRTLPALAEGGDGRGLRWLRDRKSKR